MEWLNVLDWRDLFEPTLPFLEVVFRGTVVYLALFALMRGVLKREAGTVGMADLLMVVLIADAAQNAMASSYDSITDGLILVGTIVFWNYALDWLGYRYRLFHRFVEPPPLLLVKDGRMLEENMKKELLTEDDLMSQLRELGISDVGEVKEAHIESSGRISAVRRNDECRPPTVRRRSGGGQHH